MDYQEFVDAMVKWIMFLIRWIFMYGMFPLILLGQQVAPIEVSVENRNLRHPLKYLDGDRSPYLLVWFRDSRERDAYLVRVVYTGNDGQRKEAAMVCTVPAAYEFRVCKMNVDADEKVPIAAQVVPVKFNEVIQ